MRKVINLTSKKSIKSKLGKKFIKNYRDRILQVRDNKLLGLFPEVAYFLKHYEEFYNNKTIQRLMKETNPNPVQVSNVLLNFLQKKNELRWVEQITNMRLGDDNIVEHVRWEFQHGKTPKNLIRYIENKYVMEYSFL